MRGTVKWFNAQRGYGFIIGEDKVERFVHQSEIQMDGFRKLKTGQCVEFEACLDEEKRESASCVRIV